MKIGRAFGGPPIKGFAQSEAEYALRKDRIIDQPRRPNISGDGEERAWNGGFHWPQSIPIHALDVIDADGGLGGEDFAG
jgi:hypothetical protein